MTPAPSPALGHRGQPLRRPSRLCATAFAAASLSAALWTAGPATAQTTQPAEQASATVNRYQPAVAPFDPSIAARLKAPAGFEVTLFASGLGHPRMLDIGPDGTVYVTRRDTHDVLALADANGDGRADSVRVFATGLDDVHGIDHRGTTLYLASSETIWSTPFAAAAPKVVVSGLPDGGQHGNRMVRFGPDGAMYVSVGSSCNDCAEENQLERATVIRYTPDGKQRTILANGLRNTIGYDWHPATRELWGMDHGSDFRGDDVPPEELNRIRAGNHYGWPVCYADRVVDPMTNAPPARLAPKPGREPLNRDVPRASFCAETEPAVATLTAHSAPMAMRFYTAAGFPEAYRNDAFIALRGSWNRGTPSGYKVVRLRYSPAGEPLGFEDFLTGFIDAGGATVYGRPVGLAITADGSLLVSDDTNGAIWRVNYKTR